ncbi:MAG: TIGR00725 family protein [Candidatus Omnitrophica bacterium]|nr:TIGR00725 family protein [Candidatus Omnitrophota bacterium]
MSLSKNGKKRVIVAVVGGHTCDAKVEQIAIKLGELLAKVGVIIVTGGLKGVMEAVSRGAKNRGGLTVGILPSEDKNAANPYVDIPIPTGLGYTRNTIVAGCADAVIALPGEYGTLSEIAFALNMKKPVIGLGSWTIPGVLEVKTAEEAVAKVLELTDGSKAKERSSNRKTS